MIDSIFIAAYLSAAIYLVLSLVNIFISKDAQEFIDSLKAILYIICANIIVKFIELCLQF